MRELKPLTISNSTKSAPSVLLTSEMKKFVFVQPVNPDLVLAQNLYSLIHKHFKVDVLAAGTFTLKGIKYMCSEAHQNMVDLEPSLDYLWSSKHNYNRLLNPSALFKMNLINLYFPIFKTKKLLLLNKKDQFIVEAYPILNNGVGIYFEKVLPGDIELTKQGYMKLFRYMRKELRKYHEEFEAIHHETLYSSLKYQVSLYPEIRNQYWEEMKKCFEPDFRSDIHSEIERYILKL